MAPHSTAQYEQHSVITARYEQHATLARALSAHAQHEYGTNNTALLLKFNCMAL